MSGARSAAAAVVGVVLALAATVLPGAAHPAAAGDGVTDVGGAPREVTRFADDRIDESSGLAAAGPVLYTVNDSGDGPYVYAVDLATGRTTAVLTYTDEEVTDVEALALHDGTLWVGDIGDNTGRRGTVELFRVPAPESSATGRVRGDREVSAQRFELDYPSGGVDAETLLVHPRTGRVYVVTKRLLGGRVYAAPRRLRTDRVNPLRQVGAVPGLLTDGVFLPEGRHVVLRGYGDAAVYTFPDLRRVARVGLPAQEQGEAITVDSAGDTLFVSTEGEGALVSAVPLLRDRLAQARPVARDAERAARAAEDDGDDGGGRRVPPGVDLDRPGWLGALTLAVVLGVFVWRLSRFVRRHGRRRR